MKRSEGKKGDRVRLIEDRSEYGLRIGNVGTMLQDNDTAPFVQWDAGPKSAVSQEALELVEPKWVPKVGDRVRLTKDNNGYGVAGDFATVVRENCGAGDCYVKFDYVIRNDTNWYVCWDKIEPLPVAAPQPAATLTIAAGKFYKTRDGRKVGPIVVAQGSGDPWPWKLKSGSHYYKADGHSCPGWANGHKDRDDLIAEWVDEPVIKAKYVGAQSAQVDSLAEEYGPSPVAVASNDNASSQDGLIKTRHGYGFEIARFGDYVWIDTGKKAPETFRASAISAA